MEKVIKKWFLVAIVGAFLAYLVAYLGNPQNLQSHLPQGALWPWNWGSNTQGAVCPSDLKNYVVSKTSGKKEINPYGRCNIGAEVVKGTVQFFDAQDKPVFYETVALGGPTSTITAGQALRGRVFQEGVVSTITWVEASTEEAQVRVKLCPPPEMVGRDGICR